ncbi:MAG TPA: Smr/MutS family protein [Casimicrobiaceae bacterium]|nr:Smr/MutS family protein [Casimicrobiaceae bacterium]
MAKLADLKALIQSARPRHGDDPARKEPPVRPATPKRRVAAAKHADGDIDIADAFADVTPLPARNAVARSGERPAPVPRQRIEDERDALELSKYGVEPSPQAWDIGQELEAAQTFLRTGLGTDVLTKLRRGHWVVQREIDLHGLVVDEAHDALADFLADARNRGLRCVRVIHGKGLTSPNREPVLKGKVRRWLSQWDEVLAYCEAQRHAGGSGAVVVLLRGR